MRSRLNGAVAVSIRASFISLALPASAPAVGGVQRAFGQISLYDTFVCSDGDGGAGGKGAWRNVWNGSYRGAVTWEV